MFGRRQRRVVYEQPSEMRGIEPDQGPYDGIPPWVMSSVFTFLAPCLRNQGLADRSFYGGSSLGDEHRDFLREVERSLRVPLDWRLGPRSAESTLVAVMQADNEKLVSVVDFALRNIEFGYGMGPELREAPEALDRALTEAGSVWTVAGDPGLGYSLQRRITAAGGALARQTQDSTDDAGSELRAAYDKAYGRNPDPSAAYRHAVKAVEAAAIAVVSPTNTRATLGTVIGEMRRSPGRFSSTMTRPARKIGPSGDDLTPVDVTIGLMDQLWHNQSDRHAPAVPITAPQAEWAVHTAALIVQVFRSGWIS